jgi:hypothetical protein
MGKEIAYKANHCIFKNKLTHMFELGILRSRIVLYFCVRDDPSVLLLCTVRIRILRRLFCSSLRRCGANGPLPSKNPLPCIPHSGHSSCVQKSIVNPFADARVGTSSLHKAAMVARVYMRRPHLFRNIFTMIMTHENDGRTRWHNECSPSSRNRENKDNRRTVDVWAERD